MKTIATLLSIFAVGTGAFAQGTVEFFPTPSTLASISTPSGPVPISGHGVYYFGLLTSPTPALGTFTFTGVYATNLTAAGYFGSPAARTVPGWAAGATMSYEVAMWSSDLGTTFQPGWLTGNFGGVTAGYFGTSAVATAESGGAGTPATPPLPLFGASAGSIGTGIVGVGFIPEPSSLALAGLGAAALLMFRRRKSKPMRGTSVILLLLVCAAAIPAQAQTTNTAISNLNQPSSGYAPIGGVPSYPPYGANSQAVSFTTGNTTSWLSSVSVSMHTGTPGTNSPSGLFLQVNSDNGGRPGGTFEVFNPITPTNSGIYTFYTGNPIPFQTNTTYWIYASSMDNYSYEWNVTTNSSLDSASDWKLGEAISASPASGNSWVPASAYPQFSVTVMTVASSLPPISVFRPLVLTFTNFQNQFVLQESPDLNGTNWTPATEATDLIQLPLQDPRSVFLVLPSDQQMFFRVVAP